MNQMSKEDVEKVGLFGDVLTSIQKYIRENKPDKVAVVQTAVEGLTMETMPLSAFIEDIESAADSKMSPEHRHKLETYLGVYIQSCRIRRGPEEGGRPQQMGGGGPTHFSNQGQQRHSPYQRPQQKAMVSPLKHNAIPPEIMNLMKPAGVGVDPVHVKEEKARGYEDEKEGGKGERGTPPTTSYWICPKCRDSGKEKKYYMFRSYSSHIADCMNIDFPDTSNPSGQQQQHPMNPPPTPMYPPPMGHNLGGQGGARPMPPPGTPGGPNRGQYPGQQPYNPYNFQVPQPFGMMPMNMPAPPTPRRPSQELHEPLGTLEFQRRVLEGIESLGREVDHMRRRMEVMETSMGMKMSNLENKFSYFPPCP